MADGRNCQDLNECDPPGLCSQSCTNTKGSYFCNCIDGYVLEADKHTCKAISMIKENKHILQQLIIITF